MANDNVETQVRVKFVSDTSGLEAAKNELAELNKLQAEINQNEQAGQVGDVAAQAAEQIQDLAEQFEDVGNGEGFNQAAEQIGQVGDAAAQAAEQIQDLAEQFADVDGGGVGQAAGQIDQVGNAAVQAAGQVQDLAEQVEGVGNADTSRTREQVNSLGNAANDARENFTDLFNELAAIKNAGDFLSGMSETLIGFGASCVTTAGEFEQLKAKLVTIQHSTKAAADTFKYAQELAASTPFDVKGVVAAAVQLEVYGQKSRELLPVVANLASAMGGDVTQAATAMGRALSGSSEGLQSLRDVFGVNTEKLAKFGAAMNAQGGIAVDTAENIGKLKTALVNLVNTEFAGGIERQSKTVAGSLSNLEDEITNTKAAIGDEFAPYVSALSSQVASLVQGLGSMAPFIAMAGGLAAAITGIAGGFVTAAASAVIFKSSLDKLGISATNLKTKLEGLKTSNPKFFSGLMTGGALTAVMLAGELLNTYLLKRIADEEKAQDGMKAETKATQDQVQVWRDVTDAVEAATGAKVKYNSAGKEESGQNLSDIVKGGVPSAKFLDELSKRGTSFEALKKAREEAKKTQEELKNVNDKIDETKKKLAAVPAGPNPSAAKTSFGTPEDPEIIAKRYTLQNELKELNKTQQELQSKANSYNNEGLIDLVDKLEEAFARLDRAQKNALSDSVFAKFAEQAGDADLLYTSIDRCRESLAGLYEASRGQTLLDDSKLKDDGERMFALAELVRKGQTTGQEYKILSSISEQTAVLAKAREALEAAHQKSFDKEVQTAGEQFARQQAGRDSDLEAERQYYEERLALYKQYRQKQSLFYAHELGHYNNGWLPGEKEALQEKHASVQRLSAGEVECLNKLHDIESSQAIETLNNAINPLVEAAQNLSSSVFALPKDVVKSYDAIIAKLHEWKQENGEVLEASKQVRESYEQTLKAQEKARQAAIDNRGNKAFQNLQEQAQTRMINASGAVRQLEAVRETTELLQRALRTNADIKASESARLQVQKQIAELSRQELSLKTQIKQLEESLGKENQSLELQLRQDELSELEERARSGEDVAQALADKEREIHEMKLRNIEEEYQKELKSVKGQEALEMQVIKKVAALRQLEENRYNRAMRNHNKDREAMVNKTSAKANSNDADSKAGGSANTTPAAHKYTAGSPLKSMQEALSEHNQWWANVVNNDPVFDDDSNAIKKHTATVKIASDRTNEMGTTAERVSVSLQKLGSSADAAASGSSGAKYKPGTKEYAEAKFDGRLTKAERLNSPGRNVSQEERNKRIKAYWEYETQQPIDDERKKKAEAYRKRQEARDAEHEKRAEAYRKRQEARDAEREKRPTYDEREEARQQKQKDWNVTVAKTREQLNRKDEENKVRVEQYRQNLKTWQSGNQLSATKSKAEALGSSFSSANSTIQQTDQALDDMAGTATTNATTLQEHAEATSTNTKAFNQNEEAVLSLTGEFNAFASAMKSAGANTGEASAEATPSAATASAAPTAVTASSTTPTTNATSMTPAVTESPTVTTTDATSMVVTSPATALATAVTPYTVAATVPTPTTHQPAAKAVGNISHSNTTNNYYIDSVRSSQSVDNRAMAAMVNKLASQEQRRIRTMTGG